MAKRKGRNYKRMMRQTSKEGKTSATIIDMEGKHAVTVMADHNLQMPELYLDVYVEGDRYDRVMFAALFSRALCKRVESPEEADLVIFTGGPDVDPALYGKQPHPKTSVCPERDETDINLYMKCLNEGIPMVGICRGAQFLHVMNGGKLFQHVENHYGDHKLWDMKQKELIHKVSSVHHQAVIPYHEGGMEIIANAIGAQCYERWTGPGEKVTDKLVDVEAFWYRDTCCFGVQGHPEYYGYNYYARWFLEKLNELFITNPDMDWGKSKHRRLKTDLLEQRKAGLGMTLPKGKE